MNIGSIMRESSNLFSAQIGRGASVREIIKLVLDATNAPFAKPIDSEIQIQSLDESHQGFVMPE
jgi:hypothetical protein